MKTMIRRELLKIVQDALTQLAAETGLDPIDRIVVLEVIAARLRSDDRSGATISSIQRSTGISYETVRRRVIGMERRRLISRTPSGLDLTSAKIMAQHTRTIDRVVTRIAPLLRHMTPPAEP